MTKISIIKARIVSIEDNLMSILSAMYLLDNTQVLDSLESYLENGGKNLTLDELKCVRLELLDEKDERNKGGKQTFEVYDGFVKKAIAEGYDAKRATRISMLLNDYLTDQHYRLLSTIPEYRNKLDKHHGKTKFFGTLTNGYDIKNDLTKSESLENRTQKESAYYGFERAVFDPHDKRPMNERLEEAEVYAEKIDHTRMSKYKAHTIEVAMNKFANETSPKRENIVGKVMSKIASYFAWRKN